MDGGEGEGHVVRRPMNAFLIFCKGHRSIVREKNPGLDNRGVTRILSDLWANLKKEEKVVYTDFAKQYKDAFMKANPDFRWYKSKKSRGCQKSVKPLAKPTNVKVMQNETNLVHEGSNIPETFVSVDSMSQCVLCDNARSDSEMKSIHKAVVMQGHPEGLTFEHALESEMLPFSSLEGKYCLSCLQACQRVSKIKRNIEDLISSQTLTGHDLSKNSKRKAASEIALPENNMKRSRMGEEITESQVQLYESEPTRFCLTDVKIEPEYDIQTQAKFESNKESPSSDQIEFEIHINPDYFIKEESEDEVQTHKEMGEFKPELSGDFSAETCTAVVKEEPELEIQTLTNAKNDSRRLSTIEVKDEAKCQSQVTEVNVPLTESIQRSSSDEGKRQSVNIMQSQSSGVNLPSKNPLLQFSPTSSCEAQGKTVLENQMLNQTFGVNCVIKAPCYTLTPANSFTSAGNTVPGNQISGVNSVNVMPSIRLVGTQSVPGGQISGVNSVNGMPSIRLVGTQSVPGSQISGVNLISRMPLLRLIPTSTCIAEGKTVPGNQMSVGQLTHTTSTLPENQMHSAVSTVNSVSNRQLFRLIPSSSVKVNEQALPLNQTQHEMSRVSFTDSAQLSGNTAGSVVADQNKPPENKILTQVSGENLFPILTLQLQKQLPLLAGNTLPANQIQVQVPGVNVLSQMQVGQQKPGSDSAIQRQEQMQQSGDDSERHELVNMQSSDVNSASPTEVQKKTSSVHSASQEQVQERQSGLNSASQKRVQQFPSDTNFENLKKEQKQPSGVNSGSQKQVQVQPSDVNSVCQMQVQVQSPDVNSGSQKQVQEQPSDVNSVCQMQVQVQSCDVNFGSQKQVQVQPSDVSSVCQMQVQVQSSDVKFGSQKLVQVQPSDVRSVCQMQVQVQSSDLNSGSQKQVQEQPSNLNSGNQKQVQVQPSVVNSGCQKLVQVQPSNVNSASHKWVQQLPCVVNSEILKKEQKKPSGVNSGSQTQVQVQLSSVNSGSQKPVQVQPSGVNSGNQKQVHMQPLGVSTVSQKQVKVKPSDLNSGSQKQVQVQPSDVNSGSQKQVQVQPSDVNSIRQKQVQVQSSGLNFSSQKPQQLQPSDFSASSQKQLQVQWPSVNSLIQKQKQVQQSGVYSSGRNQVQVQTSGVDSPSQKQQPDCIKGHQLHSFEIELQGHDSGVNYEFFSADEKQGENVPLTKDIKTQKEIISKLLHCKNFDALVIIAFRIKQVRNCIEEKMLIDTDRACERICFKDHELGNLLKFDLATSGKMDINIFDKVILEMQKTVPFLTRVLRAICLSPSYKPSTKYTLVMMFAMGMHVRNPNMSYLQQLNTCLIDEYESAEVLNVLSKCSFTLDSDAKEMFVQRMKKMKPGLLANIEGNEIVDSRDVSATSDNSLEAYLLPTLIDNETDEEFIHFINKARNCSDLEDFVELALETKEIRCRVEYVLLREIDGSCETMCVKTYPGRDLSMLRDDLASQDKIKTGLFEAVGQEVMERNPFLYNVLKTMCTVKPTTSCTLPMIFAMGIQTRCIQMSYLQQLNTILLGKDKNFYLLNMLCKLHFTLSSFAARTLLKKKKELKAQFLADEVEREKKLSKVQLFHSLLPTAKKFNTEKKSDAVETTHNTEEKMEESSAETDPNEKGKKFSKVQLFHSLLPDSSGRNTNKYNTENKINSVQTTHKTEGYVEESSTETQTKTNDVVQTTHHTEENVEESSTETQTKTNVIDKKSSENIVTGDSESCPSTSKEIEDAKLDTNSDTLELDGDTGRSSVSEKVKRQTNQEKNANLPKSQLLNPVVHVRPEERRAADAVLNKIDSKRKEIDSKRKEIDSKRKEIDSKPKQIDSEPKEIDSEPKQIDSESKEIDSEPKEIDSEPKQIDSEPKKRKRAVKDCTGIKPYYETAKIMAEAEYRAIREEYKTVLMSIASPATETRGTEESSHGGTQGGKTCRSLIFIVEQYEKLFSSIGRSEITPRIRDKVR